MKVSMFNCFTLIFKVYRILCSLIVKVYCEIIKRHFLALVYCSEILIEVVTRVNTLQLVTEHAHDLLLGQRFAWGGLQALVVVVGHLGSRRVLSVLQELTQLLTLVLHTLEMFKLGSIVVTRSRFRCLLIGEDCLRLAWFVTVLGLAVLRRRREEVDRFKWLSTGNVFELALLWR